MNNPIKLQSNRPKWSLLVVKKVWADSYNNSYERLKDEKHGILSSGVPGPELKYLRKNIVRSEASSPSTKKSRLFTDNHAWNARSVRNFTSFESAFRDVIRGVVDLDC